MSEVEEVGTCRGGIADSRRQDPWPRDHCQSGEQFDR